MNKECLLKAPVIISNLYRAWKARRQFGYCGAKLSVGKDLVINRGYQMSIGDSFSIMDRGYLNGAIKAGNRISINNNVAIDAGRGRIEIGDDVLIGSNVVIRASNHNYSRTDITMNQQGHTEGFVIIESDVWIGANCTITAGVRIGQGSIISAGSKVRHNVLPYSIAEGVPSVVIRSRK